MSDSAFRRLILDTVATVIVQPPSSSSLIDLLRIATPSLLAPSSLSPSTALSNDGKQQSEAKVRIKSKRDKLFRTLQLRIHPDKHPGDERATTLFQDVTTYYEKCVDAMEREDIRQRQRGVNDIAKDSRTNDPATATTNNDRNVHWRRDEEKGNTSATRNGNGNAYYHGKYGHNTQIPRRPTTTQSTTHSDYTNCDGQQQTNGRRRKNNSRLDLVETHPPNHACPATASLLLCPPIGLYSLYHSIQVKRSWDEGHYGDARKHSEKALNYALCGYLTFGCFVLYLLLSGDGGPDSGWERIMKNLPWEWDNGP